MTEPLPRSVKTWLTNRTDPPSSAVHQLAKLTVRLCPHVPNCQFIDEPDLHIERPCHRGCSLDLAPTKSECLTTDCTRLQGTRTFGLCDHCYEDILQGHGHTAA